MSKIVYRAADFYVTDNGRRYSVYTTTGGAAEYYGSYSSLDAAINAMINCYIRTTVDDWRTIMTANWGR